MATPKQMEKELKNGLSIILDEIMTEEYMEGFELSSRNYLNEEYYEAFIDKYTFRRFNICPYNTAYILIKNEVIVKRVKVYTKDECSEDVNQYDGDDIEVHNITKQIFDIYVKTPEQLLEEIIALFIAIFDKKRLVYDKIENKFRTKKDVIRRQQIAKAFKEDGIEICPVCLELTKTTTNCKHHLCYQCWGALHKKICPICRAGCKDKIICYECGLNHSS